MRARLFVPVAFCVLLVAGALANCSGGDGAAPFVPFPEIDDSAVTWHSREGSVCVEPAGAVDALGRTWVSWIAFRGSGADWKPRLVAGPLGTVNAIDEGLSSPAAAVLASRGEGAYALFEAVDGDGEHGIFGRALDLREGRATTGSLERVAVGRALLPAAAETAPGVVETVFMRLAGASYELAWRRRDADGAWTTPRVVASGTDGVFDAWRPRAASAGDGVLHVVYDVWTGTSFDVRYLALRDGEVVTELAVADGPIYEGLPDLALDAAGRVWIAWEEAEQFGEAGGLREGRRVRLGAVVEGKLHHAGSLFGSADLPRIACAPEGLVVTARQAGPTWPPKGEEEWAPFYASWHTRVTVWGSDQQYLSLRAADGDNDATEVLLPTEGGVRVLFAADRRTQRRPKPGAFQEPTEHLWRVGSVELTSEGFPPLGPPERVPRTDERPSRRPPRGAREAPYLGDLHRHTHLSRCQGAKDGTRLDAYRYARGPGELDFLSITDHYQHLTPWSWWRSLRDVERFHAPGSLVTFAGIERALRTRAHVNEIYLHTSEVSRRIPDFHREPAEPGRMPAEHALAIPHMMGMEGAPFPWEEFDEEFHRLIEVYQGLRGSYEGPGLPYEALNRTVDGSSIAAGLQRGEHFGLIASSDHRASSTAYAGVWAEAPTRASIFAALRARRTFAASAPWFAVDARIGPLAMGERGRAPVDAELTLDVDGSGPATIEVVKNGELFARRDGDASGNEHIGVSVRDYRPGPFSMGFENHQNLWPTIRQRGGAREGSSTSMIVIEKGVPFVDVTMIAGESGDGPPSDPVLVLERDGSRARVPVGEIPPGGFVRDIEGLPSVSVWRLGKALVPTGGGATFRFPDPDREPGDVYYARIAFPDGSIAWTSPIRVTEVGE